MQLCLAFVVLMLVFYYRLSLPKEIDHDDSMLAQTTNFERFDVQAPLQEQEFLSSRRYSTE